MAAESTKFPTKGEAEAFANSLGQVGFAHHTPRGWIFALLHEGAWYGLIDEDSMVLLWDW